MKVTSSYSSVYDGLVGEESALNGLLDFRKVVLEPSVLLSALERVVRVDERDVQ